MLSTIEFQTHHPSVQSIFKRLLDVSGSIIGLALLTVLFVPIAIAIKLDSSGPIFYSQQRCGLYGKPFQIWKFRSMTIDADRRQHEVQNQATGFIFKNDRDPRITRVGRFLRRTSLDEFPQFWNVFLGDMSLVGTRPPTANEVENYSDRHWRRLDVKPGITGEWQANGRSSVTDFETIVDMDLNYQEKWSIAYDCQLILKTVCVVFARVGAC